MFNWSDYCDISKANVFPDGKATIYKYNPGDRVYHVLGDRFGTVEKYFLYNETWYVIRWDGTGSGTWSVPEFLLLPERLVTTTLYELIHGRSLTES